MRKYIIAGLLTTCLVCAAFGAPARAFEASALEGNAYTVFMYCTQQAGDYCEGQFQRDTFTFDGGEFVIDSFDEALWGFGDDGSFSESGPVFNADLEVLDENAEKYEFSALGINVLDELIIGSMDIIFSEWDIWKFDFSKEDEATAYFFGIKE